MGIRWYYNCLISRVGFPILLRWHLYIESDTRPIYPWTCLTCCKTDILAVKPVSYLAIKGGWYKDCQSRYRDSHYKDKMVISPSYLYIGHSFPGPVFYLLHGVSSDYAQPITGQVTEVTCPVIGRAQPELTLSKRQKTCPGKVASLYRNASLPYAECVRYLLHIFNRCDETICNIDGLVPERRNSSALAMELRLSCINHRYMGKSGIF